MSAKRRRRPRVVRRPHGNERFRHRRRSSSAPPPPLQPSDCAFELCLDQNEEQTKLNHVRGFKIEPIKEQPAIA